jgi:hypothetical protein
MIVGRQMRRAEYVAGVHVITDARWPVGPHFERDKEALYAQMRADFEQRLNQPWVRVSTPGDFVRVTMP